MARILIAGAGLAGRLCAWALSRTGHAVTVCDPSPDAGARFDGTGAAAFTAAGMLSPLAEQEQGGARVAAWGWRSLTLWTGIVQALRPLEVPFRRDGSLLLAHRSDLGSAQRILALIPGSEALSASALQALEPTLVPGLHGWLLPEEGLIGPVAAMRALLQSAPHVDWRWGCAVQAVMPCALVLTSGERLAADWVIDTRGLGAAPDLPVRGVRGEIVTLSLPGHGLRRPVRLLHPRHRVYLVPRTADELAVGASEIESEDRSPVSLRSAVELMAAAHSVMPALTEARILRLDRHLRPALPDNLPALAHAPGLLRLNGLYRHGWLLAPAMVEHMLGGAGLASLHALAQVAPITAAAAAAGAAPAAVPHQQSPLRPPVGERTIPPTPPTPPTPAFPPAFPPASPPAFSPLSPLAGIPLPPSSS
ncbi:FAD-dependent oxidoreductase [Roseateles terrae]|uniref:Glycine oxidase n=1 Tax=Roseateles terrae TaxID=431060 RepID=A0ABR6GYX1_9BURK|nr:FAD-dependent oxidoreductase [Roseateles terrae]MBB3197260.1 glycine oxidase [Roseateles terrae]